MKMKKLATDLHKTDTDKDYKESVLSLCPSVAKN